MNVYYRELLKKKQQQNDFKRNEDRVNVNHAINDEVFALIRFISHSEKFWLWKILIRKDKDHSALDIEHNFVSSVVTKF